MQRWILMITLATMAGLAAGCGDGMAKTRRERAEEYRHVVESDMKQLNDDLDSFWLMDRPSRLSWWRVP